MGVIASGIVNWHSWHKSILTYHWKPHYSK